MSAPPREPARPEGSAALVSLDVLRLELAGRRCGWRGCGQPAGALVESEQRPRAYCSEHARAAEQLLGRRVLVWPLCAVEGCRELGRAVGVVERTARSSEVALVCGRHAAGYGASSA